MTGRAAGRGDGRPVIVVVAGESEKGKTKALNNIFSVDFEESSTTDISVRERRINGNSYILVDTPGFTVSNSKWVKERVKEQLEKAVRGLDFTLLFCVSISIGETLDVCAHTMADLQNCLHSRIWEKCVLLFTHSDDAIRHFKDQYPNDYIQHYKDHIKKKAKGFQAIVKNISSSALEVNTVFDYRDDSIRQNAGFPGIVAVPVRCRLDSVVGTQGDHDINGSAGGEGRVRREGEGGEGECGGEGGHRGGGEKEEERRGRSEESEGRKFERLPDIIPGIPESESWCNVAMAEIGNKIAPLEGELERKHFKSVVVTVGATIAGGAAGAAAGAGAGMIIGIAGGPIGIAIGASIGGPVGATVGLASGLSIGATVSYYKWIKTNTQEKIMNLRLKIHCTNQSD